MVSSNLPYVLTINVSGSCHWSMLFCPRTHDDSVPRLLSRYMPKKNMRFLWACILLNFDASVRMCTTKQMTGRNIAKFGGISSKQTHLNCGDKSYDEYRKKIRMLLPCRYIRLWTFEMGARLTSLNEKGILQFF